MTLQKPVREQSVNRLKLIVFDVDGVFTDGRAWLDAKGQWRRSFSVRDTMGVRALRRAGYKVAVMTSLTSNEVEDHFRFVGVDLFHVYTGDKAQALRKIFYTLDEKANETCFVTEDSSDLELLRLIGFGVAIGSSSEDLQQAARFVTSKTGGDGAVLEISNLLLTYMHSQETHL
jgi:3-deoxy-D-manno-octulosonate 8-phosphate phosphatase (KDO 8-P phosphatase)